MQPPTLQYTQPPTLQHTSHHATPHTSQHTIQPLTVTNRQQPALQQAISKPPRQKGLKQPQDESVSYVCTLCETPTKFTTFNKLDNHVRRFHSDFNQKERGNKRKGRKEEVYPKKGRWDWG